MPRRKGVAEVDGERASHELKPDFRYIEAHNDDGHVGFRNVDLRGVNSIPYESIGDRYVAAVILDGHSPQESFRQASIASVYRALLVWSIGLQCWNSTPSLRPSAFRVLKEPEPSVFNFESRRIHLLS